MTAYDKPMTIQMLDDLFDALKINKCIVTFLRTRKVCIITLFQIDNPIPCAGEGKTFEMALSKAIRKAQDQIHLMEFPDIPCHSCSNTTDVRDIGNGNLRCSACRCEMGISSND